MKKIIILLSIFILAISCSTKTGVQDKNNNTAGDVMIHNETIDDITSKIKKKESNDPAYFELNPPQSAILRSSLTIFEKAYERLYSDATVTDFITNDKIVALLTKNQIILNMPACPSIVTDHEYTSLSLSDTYLIAYNRSLITLYSLNDCAKVATYSRILTKSASIIKDYVLEFESSRVVVRNMVNGDIISAVDTDINIVIPLIYKGKLSLIHSNGYITYFDDKLKSFLMLGSLPVIFKEVTAINNMILGVNLKDELFTYDNDNYELTGFTKCKLSRNSPSAICDNKLIYKGKSFPDIELGSNFIAGTNLYIVANKTTTNIYDLKKTFQKYIQFDYKLPKSCITPKGNIYFTSLNGKPVGLINGNELLVNKMPEKCDYRRSIIKNGKFYCNDKICGEFADLVLSDNTSNLYKRMEDGKLFYYFEER